MKRRRNNEEDKLQTAVVLHLQIRGAPGLVYWHVPNQAKRSIAERVRLKRMGLRSGVSDLIFLHESKMFALELKVPPKRSTENQIKFRDDVNAAGGFAAEAIGLDSALKTLEIWGLLRVAA